MCDPVYLLKNRLWFDVKNLTDEGENADRYCFFTFMFILSALMCDPVQGRCSPAHHRIMRGAPSGLFPYFAPKKTRNAPILITYTL